MQKTLDKLLTLPEPEFSWHPGKDTALLDLGLTLDDAPDLIAIANLEHIRANPNQESTAANWDAANNACRALAELRHPDHLDVFLDLLKLPEFADSDIFNEDLAAIVPLYGDAAIEPCLAELEDQGFSEIYRLVYIDILEKLASAGHQKEFIIERYTAYLNQKQFTRKLNASIVAALLELKATSAFEAIRSCYNAHLVDITMNGDLEQVELDLGLRDARSSAPDLNWQELERKSEHEAIKADLGPRPKAEVDLFLYLFSLYGRDCSVSSFSGLHATLTSAILSPRFVKPSEYLPFMWDTTNNEKPYTPVWENKEDAQFFTRFLMMIHNQIIATLDQGSFEPVPDEHADGSGFRSYASWLLFFSGGFGHWNPVSSQDELKENQLQILNHTAAIIQEETQAMEQGELPDTTSEVNQLSSLLCRMYAENKNPNTNLLSGLKSSNPYRPSRSLETYTRDQPKISRNAPCPCGSGKKYKRCCLKKSSAH